MTHTNVDRLEEIKAGVKQTYLDLIDQHHTRAYYERLLEEIDDDVAKEFATALSQARQEGREELKEAALAVVKEQDFVKDLLTWGDMVSILLVKTY